MTRTTFVSLLLSLALAGCGNGSGNNNTPDMAGFPAAPTIGAQIDRMGRPGVNTALTDPFWDTKGDGTGLEAHHAKQDTYNQADPSMWASFAPTIKKSIAVYDSLDQDLVAAGTQSCGNQLAYGALGMADYTLLSVVLADDELYVNSNNGTCAAYLGVEAATLGSANSDCGGRTPTENTIDVTYAALASAAVLAAGPPNLNGVAADTDGSPGQDAFPFLGAPNNN